MSNRSKNLLEAFQASKSIEEPNVRERKLPRSPTSSSPAQVSGPFAGGAPVEGGSLLGSETVTARTAVPRNALEELAREPWKFALAAGVVLLMTFGFGMWFGGDSTVEANGDRSGGGDPNADGPEEAGLRAGIDSSGTGPSSNGKPAGSGAPATNENAGGSGRAAGQGSSSVPANDTALYDPANKYTVKVIEYKRTERNLEWAWGTYDHLLEQELPVFSVQGSEDSLFLFVGAAPDRDSLLTLRGEIRATTGPGGRRLDFENALIVPIKSYIRR